MRARPPLKLTELLKQVGQGSAQAGSEHPQLRGIHNHTGEPIPGSTNLTANPFLLVGISLFKTCVHSLSAFDAHLQEQQVSIYLF